MINKSLLQRNLGLVTEEQYQILSNKRVLIAGCGVGSVVAAGIVRTGIHNFTLADGDVVEETNLNRQEFSSKDIGENKATALSNRLKDINPHVLTKVISDFLDDSNIDEALVGVDVVIDAIDPIESPRAVIELHKKAAKKGIPVVYPLDIGWGGGVFIFTSKSAALEDMLGIKKLEHTDVDILRAQFISYFAGIVPSYFGQVMSDVMNGKLENIPQPATAAYITAALSVIAVKRLLLGLPVKLAPEIISFDPHTPHEIGV